MFHVMSKISQSILLSLKLTYGWEQYSQQN